MPVQALVGELFMKTGHIKEALVLAFNPPPIFGLGTAGGFELYLQNRGEGGAKRLAEVSQQFMGAASQSKLLGRRADACGAPATPQLYVDVDRERAKALGVPVDEVFNTLSATLGSYYVNDFNKYGRTWQVLMSAESGFRKRPDDIGRMWVRSDSGEMVPVSALASVKYSSGPEMLDRFNNLPAVKLFGQGAPGVSSGQAIAEVERIAREVLPPDFSFDWGGASYQEKRASGTSGLALVLGALMVFLILSAQYEKWSLPLSRAAGAAVRHLRRAGRGVAARHDQRRVLPDRPGHAARPGGQERDPDRRIRVAQAPRGHERVGRCAGGRAAALPADHHDLAGVHPRRAAAGVFQRRGRRRRGARWAPA